MQKNLANRKKEPTLTYVLAGFECLNEIKSYWSTLLKNVENE